MLLNCDSNILILSNDYSFLFTLLFLDDINLDKNEDIVIMISSISDFLSKMVSSSICPFIFSISSWIVVTKSTNFGFRYLYPSLDPTLTCLEISHFCYSLTVPSFISRPLSGNHNSLQQFF